MTTTTTTTTTMPCINTKIIAKSDQMENTKKERKK
jgi:hypothetical protein